MIFHFYEVTPEPHECEEYVELDNWNEATSYARDLGDEWRNRVRIYEDGTDYSDVVGVPRAKHIEQSVNNQVDEIMKENEQREQRAQERARYGY